MRTAKDLFRASPQFSEYQAMLTNTAFEPACQAALNTLVHSFPETTGDPSKSWDVHCQLVGARRVLDILSRLHEPDTNPQKEQWPELSYGQQPK